MEIWNWRSDMVDARGDTRMGVDNAVNGIRVTHPVGGRQTHPVGGLQAPTVVANTYRLTIIILLFIFASSIHAQSNPRIDISLNSRWHTVADDQNKNAFTGFEEASFNDTKWKAVDVPHNWDAYEGYRRMRHGNRHGYAWYRKSFSIKLTGTNKHYFLFFEGVGSYATVWLNGKLVGTHGGGRTTFTLDVTAAIKKNGEQNILAVRADHPANIRDLPWVCGGCSDERGFSEGSQPMGIFRPVHLMVTNEVRIEPFGVHVWNDTTVSTSSAQLYIETQIKNYSASNKTIVIANQLLDRNGKMVNSISETKEILSNETIIVKQEPSLIRNPKLWSLDSPYLYSLVTEIFENGKLIDRITTPYGIRWISWPVGKSSKQFLLNGKPVFVNGIAEYEHELGNSHAFSAEEIRARVMMIRAAGFNAFRDAHQPHNLRYQNYWDSLGMLWWPQMSAHIWFDSQAFRNNFKALLRDWVKERRNSPSLVLWGLQNESKLPEDFAKECTAIIREMDPTASSQRLVTTCNGGTGTDWDVPQNWTGTYGGDPATYGDDIKKQVLVGEYGAWRTSELHSEDASYKSNVYSEERMTEMMETKIRLAEQSKDSCAGHFMWLFSSHDNPGRVQAGEGYRELDRIGPVNYKGLFTSWGEPTDAYYMYRSNYAPKDKQPMVYIVSHTWPSRWTKPGIKNNIVVYSNCDEVELFNDVREHSLGRKKRNGIGTHFQWDGVNIQFNVLYAVGYVNGKEVTTDCIVLSHLPSSPNFNQLNKDAKNITKPVAGYNYLYRVNCGGGKYVDENGSKWVADRENDGENSWGSVSWNDDFDEIPPYFASQQRIFDPINGTKDWKLFQTFRYGREELQYHFPVPEGDYLIELYFTEPWLGAGGQINCTAWRLFDVAINNKTVLKNFDIWKEAGRGALKKTVRITIKGSGLLITFPRIMSGQAIISAIAIATINPNTKPAPASQSILKILNKDESNKWSVESWLDLGNEQYNKSKIHFSSLPPEIFGAEWIKMNQPDGNHNPMPAIECTSEADVYVGIDSTQHLPKWLNDFAKSGSLLKNDKGETFVLYKKRFQKGQRLSLEGDKFAPPVNLIVMAQPASYMEPAYDLKPVSSYKAIDAQWSGEGINNGKVEGKDRVIFNRASANNLLEWTFNVGVGDMYSLTISYNNPQTKEIKGKLQLLMAGGHLLKEEEIVFTPTAVGKSNYISTNTGTMINAGKYFLRLTSKEAEGLSINSLDVQ